MLILIIVNHLCILDSFSAEMRKLSNKFTISSVLTEGDPVTAAQGGVNVVTNLFNRNFTVCIEGGSCIKIKDFPTSLVLAFKLIFILNVGYKGPSKCVYGAIEALSGIKMRQKVHLGTNSKFQICLRMVSISASGVKLVCLQWSESKPDSTLEFSVLKTPMHKFLEQSGQPVAFDSIHFNFCMMTCESDF